MLRRLFGVFLFGILLTGCAPETPVPPIPVVHIDPLRGEAPLFVRGSARGSWDPDGSVQAVRWNFGDGIGQEGWEVVHRYDQEGDFLVTVEVVDDKGLSTKVCIPINVGVSYPLDVLEWNVEKYYAGTRVYGRVKNIGERRINLGRVAVRFYDEDWNFLEEQSKVLGDLLPEMEQIFEVRSRYVPEQIPHRTIYTEVIHTNEGE